MRDLLIFPFNGNGIEALECLGQDFNFLGFIDDTIEKQGRNALGFIVYDRSALKKFPHAMVLAVPGSPTSFRQRKEIIEGLGVQPERFAKVIHPKASISTLAVVGHNTLIMSGVVLTSNCRIGNNVCLLPNTVIHHDSSVADYTLVGSNVTIAGNTKIGGTCYIGSGTSIMNGLTIGDNTLIGMGSNVIRSVNSNQKVAGNPARLIN